MKSGIHVLGLGFQRLAVVLGLAVLGVVFAYVVWVFVLLVVQAVGSFGQS